MRIQDHGVLREAEPLLDPPAPLAVPNQLQLVAEAPHQAGGRRDLAAGRRDQAVHVVAEPDAVPVAVVGPRPGLPALSRPLRGGVLVAVPEDYGQRDLLPEHVRAHRGHEPDEVPERDGHYLRPQERPVPRREHRHHLRVPRRPRGEAAAEAHPQPEPEGLPVLQPVAAGQDAHRQVRLVVELVRRILREEAHQEAPQHVGQEIIEQRPARPPRPVRRDARPPRHGARAVQGEPQPHPSPAPQLGAQGQGGPLHPPALRVRQAPDQAAAAAGPPPRPPPVGAPGAAGRPGEPRAGVDPLLPPVPGGRPLHLEGGRRPAAGAAGPRCAPLVHGGRASPQPASPSQPGRAARARVCLS